MYQTTAYPGTRRATRNAFLNIMKMWQYTPRNVVDAISILMQECLQLFRIDSGYLLTRDGFVILHFSEHLSVSNNSYRISLRLEKDCSFEKAIPIQSHNEAVLLANESLEALGYDILLFICQCYMSSKDFELKGDIAEKALRIQRKTELPWDVSHLLANVSDVKMLEECISEVKNARLYNFNTDNGPFLISQLCSGNKVQIRYALKKILSKNAYEALNLETRGHRYLNSLASYIVSDRIA